ncbi:hypothetical protein CKM354_001163900 [Cercospora kikuchii]|uniref:Uncharacterized protein n=1 Tax=Cercospora kikuchii TaxID=84275 RepID=A0A9P3FLB7_9PEZI|nr:uncharacterized protein CKM354_001163900 [Cercospora kikuchii]GIZ48585.1 hypothetical protein CKM354_001163900 [Cercospora kikuchii]
MSFADEVNDVVASIRDSIAFQLRSQYPYMETATLEKLLDDSVKPLKLGILHQEPEMQEKKARSSFMSLSPELRNMIYEMALFDEGGVQIPFDRTFQTTRLRRHTALLCVSRQINEEARTIWYGMNTFKYHLCWLPGEPVSPLMRSASFGRPEYLNEWLKQIGPNVALIKTIELTLGRAIDPQWLTRLSIVHGGSLIDTGLTVHQTMLHLYGLADAGLAAEVFQMKVDFRHDVEGPERWADLYETAGINGQELFTRKLLAGCIKWKATSHEQSLTGSAAHASLHIKL